MKYITKYNESSGLSFDYINLVFADFLDNKNSYIEAPDKKYGKNYWKICLYDISFLDIIDHNAPDIRKLISKLDQYKTYLEEIELCINKVRLEYPNIRHHIYINDNGILSLTIF